MQKPITFHNHPLSGVREVVQAAPATIAEKDLVATRALRGVAGDLYLFRAHSPGSGIIPARSDLDRTVGHCFWFCGPAPWPRNYCPAAQVSPYES